MKKCPYCSEVINDEAIKCRYCGKFLPYGAKFKAKYLSNIPRLVILSILFIAAVGIIINRVNSYRENLPENRIKRAEEAVIRSNAYASSHEYFRALEQADLAVNTAPDYAPAYSARGWVYLLLKKYDFARADFLRAIEKDSLGANYYYGAGLSASYLNDFHDAVYFLQRAVRHSKKPEYYCNLAHSKIMVLLLEGGRNPQLDLIMEDSRFADAMNDFDTAVKLDPNYGRTYYLRGMVKDTFGIEGAASDLEKAKNFGYDNEHFMSMID